MATTTKVGGVGASAKPAPADGKWDWINPSDLDVQKSGEWALKEQNRKQGSDLRLNTIEESWVMPLAEDYGNLYLLHIHALKGTMRYKYQAFVWAKPAMWAEDRNTLLSFKELSA